MSRKKTNASRPEDAAKGSSRRVAAGSVRVPGESDALDVEITIDDFEVAMHAGRVEIGTWLRSMVTIRRIDDISFEFIAEEDRLLFVPEDPETLARHPAVQALETDKEARQREKRAARDAKRAAKEAEKAAKAARKAAVREEKRRAAEVSAGEADVVAADAVPEFEPTADFEPSAENADVVEDVEEEPDKGPNRLWIRAIDVARRYDLLGLDRVPIDESLRGQEHQHTWEHRVATASGAGAHICTICGKIRRRTEPSHPAAEVDEGEK